MTHSDGAPLQLGLVTSAERDARVLLGTGHTPDTAVQRLALNGLVQGGALSQRAAHRVSDALKVAG